jgi:hypothetical protein
MTRQAIMRNQEKKRVRSHTRRRSLRWLFVVGIALAIVTGWVTLTIQSQRKAKVVGDAIEKEGGVVRYQVTWFGKLLRNDFLVQVFYVGLDGERVHDAALVHLEELNDVSVLSLQGTSVTDAGLVHLRGLKGLKVLFLDRSKITGKGLINLQHLRALWFLDLSGTQITDRELENLRGFTQVRLLDLDDTRVTDSGVDKLHRALPRCLITCERSTAH